jgi:hypothetical protein
MCVGGGWCNPGELRVDRSDSISNPFERESAGAFTDLVQALSAIEQHRPARDAR